MTVRDWQKIVGLELIIARGDECGGQHYLPHKCVHPQGLSLDVNEVIIPKSVFQKLTRKKKRYFYHIYNCELCCRWFHENHGHSREYRRWFMEYISRLYGGVEVTNWIANSPLKLRRPI